MASRPRVVECYLFAHGGQVFAFLDTEQPYNLPECAELQRQTKQASGRQLGTMELRLIENARFPTHQGFAILTDRRGANHRAFESAVRKIFDGAQLKLRWVTNFRQDDGSLFMALIAREILRGT